MTNMTFGAQELVSQVSDDMTLQRHLARWRYYKGPVNKVPVAIDGTGVLNTELRQ